MGIVGKCVRNDDEKAKTDQRDLSCKKRKE